MDLAFLFDIINMKWSNVYSERLQVIMPKISPLRDFATFVYDVIF